jgi:hypothetical protein
MKSGRAVFAASALGNEVVQMAETPPFFAGAGKTT